MVGDDGNWLATRGAGWCGRIRLATLDPAAGYRRAFEDHLLNATLVVDHFHAVRLANRAIDEVGRRVQNEALAHRGRKADPLYRARRVLLTADERLTEVRFQWMGMLLELGDPDGEVAARWIAKELRDVYGAANEDHTRRCADADVPEPRRLARTISRRAEQVLAYHRTGGASNGRVENTQILTGNFSRNSHGFTNHQNYRRRLIGRQGIKSLTRPIARIRAANQRFIA